METCQRCDRRAARLHFVPPGVVTRGLVDALGGPEAAGDLELCRDCVDDLLEGEAPA